MTKIAGASGGRCVQRAISTMRLALGYAEGLPDWWGNRANVLDYELCPLLSELFPEHHVRVWHSDHGDFEGLRDGFEYMGSSYTTPEDDIWLTAFIYLNKAKDTGHCAIGEPVTYDHLPIALMWAVELGEGT